MTIEIDDENIPTVALIGAIREHSRSRLAIFTLAIFAVLAVVPIFTVLLKSESSKIIDDVSKVLQIVFAPVVGIVGTVVGFYFGAKQDDEEV